MSRPVLRSWRVVGGLIEAGDSVLLVQNSRRDGSLDWSPPGGVVEDPESPLEGLTREVLEETGILVHEWEGPAYEVEVVAASLGWVLAAQVFCARQFSGRLRVCDPDGIVVRAEFVPRLLADRRLGSSRPWVGEPLASYLDDPAGARRLWRYRIGEDLVVRRG